MPDQLSLVAGLVAGVAAIVLPAIMRSTDDRAMVGSVVGVLILVGTDHAPWGLAIAVALILLGWHAGFVTRALAILLAAVLMAMALPRGTDGWLEWLTVVAVLAGMRVVHHARRPFGDAPAAALLAWVPVAAYLATPDTEQVTVVAALLVILAGAELVTGPRGSDQGAAALAALVVWAIAAGSSGREAAALGALGCFAVLLAGPTGRLLGRRVRWRSARGVTLVALHLGAGIAVARFAGLERGVGAALWRTMVVVWPTFLVAVVLLASMPSSRARV